MRPDTVQTTCLARVAYQIGLECPGTIYPNRSIRLKFPRYLQFAKALALAVPHGGQAKQDGAILQFAKKLLRRHRLEYLELICTERHFKSRAWNDFDPRDAIHRFLILKPLRQMDTEGNLAIVEVEDRKALA